MNLKKLGTTFVVLLALGAVSAGSASAAAVTVTRQWETSPAGGGSVTPLVGSQTVTAGLTGVATFETVVGTTLFKFEASGLECVSCTIFNFSKGAKGEGSLRFTGVKVVTPTACKVKTEKIPTQLLKFDATYMNSATGPIPYMLIEPASEGTFASVTLENSGTTSCPISASYKITGRLFLEMRDGTGVYATSLTGNSSKMINEDASGLAEPLKFGAKEMDFVGSPTFEAEKKLFGVE